MTKDFIKVKNYGDMLALVNDCELIYYKKDGNYSGEYVALLADKDRMYVYQDYFGSCSVCDWLESVDTDYSDGEYTIFYSDAVKYCKNEGQPKFIVPYKEDKFWLKEVIKLLDINMEDL